jgi:formylglycine-generating enzyme required for sulfatase activity
MSFQNKNNLPKSLFVPIKINTANFDDCAGRPTTVGSNGGPSAYGTYDQSGNIWELNDLNNTNSNLRGARGGAYNSSFGVLSSFGRGTVSTSSKLEILGFRLASVSNPLNLKNYFVTVGDAGNNNDVINTDINYGKVDNIYQIGKYPVTNDEYVEFLNAVASTSDPYELYDDNIVNEILGGIIVEEILGNYVYSVKPNMDKKPVIFINWFSAARYCNWLHNGKGNGSTENGAYNIPDGRIIGDAVPRSPNANYYIPTENEWYKAAYYKSGSSNAEYWFFATQNDNIPECITANSFGDGPVFCCCHHVCVESYNEENKCIVNSIEVDFNLKEPTVFKNKEYELIIEGDCVDREQDILNIVNDKDICYGCGINEEIPVSKICNRKILPEADFSAQTICSCNLSLRFKNFRINKNYKNTNYDIIKIYRNGEIIPIYDSGPIQTDGELLTLLNDVTINCNPIDDEPALNCDNLICPPNLIPDFSSCLCVSRPACRENCDTETVDPVINYNNLLPNIKGYAYYVHDMKNSDIYVPNIGFMLSVCGGGHVCDRTIFTPKLILNNNSFVLANKNINLNNSRTRDMVSSPIDGHTHSNLLDRSDVFEFNVSDTSLLSGGKLTLDCANNFCHSGVTMLVLVGTTINGENILLFSSCSAPGKIKDIGTIDCPGNIVCCDEDNLATRCPDPSPSPTPTMTKTPRPSVSPTPTPTPTPTYNDQIISQILNDIIP